MKILIDIKELARRLSLSVGGLYNKASRREIPFVKIGRSLRFDWEEIEEKLLKRSTIGSLAKKG
jgi:excisionase family DNA binding protein